MRIKQSLCLPMYGSVKPEVLIPAVAKIGFAAIEFWGWDDSLRSVVDLAHKHKMAVASMSGPWIGLNDPANHDKAGQEIHRCIDIAVQQGIPNLICFSGDRRPGLTDADGIEFTAAGLKMVAPYAQQKGITLNLELLNSKVDHKGYQCDHTAWGVAVCEKVGSPAVKVLYDIYHMQIMEGDIIRTLRDNIEWIGHFHTAGNPGRNDIDDLQELNYTGICRAIAATPFGGYVAHEFAPKGDAIEALRSAFKQCDQG